MIRVRVSRMINSRQLAYLDAMDIGVWSLREAATLATPSPAGSAVKNAPGLKLGPGGGGILLLCATDTDSASRLANDIARALGNVPVWAWPDEDAASVELASAVEDNLFTTVAIFGDALAAQFFNGDLPGSLNSAKLVLLPAMHDLQSQAQARQVLWTTFCRAGMVSAN